MALMILTQMYGQEKGIFPRGQRAAGAWRSPFTPF